MRNNVGKGHAAAGADSNLRRPEARGKTEGDGRGEVWRMSPYERGRESTAPEAARDAAPDSVTPGPGKGLWAPGGFGGATRPDTEPGCALPIRRSEPYRERAGCTRVSA